MRAHDKKKETRRIWREQVGKGKVNQANGDWQTAQSSSTTAQHLIAGYHLGQYKRR